MRTHENRLKDMALMADNIGDHISAIYQESCKSTHVSTDYLLEKIERSERELSRMKRSVKNAIKGMPDLTSL